MIYIDRRIGGRERYVLTDQPEKLMQIPPEITKAVVFLAHQNGADYDCQGTAFIVVKPFSPSQGHYYLVTAKHNLEKLCDFEDVPLRINLKNGSYLWLNTIKSEWIGHPTDDSVDVLVREFELDSKFDQLPFPTDATATSEIMERHSLNVGRQVFLAGLFYPHQGKNKNIPIIRVGNIAALPQEKVMTEDGIMIDAYLVEVRSIGGLSGSPVFIYFEELQIHHSPITAAGMTYTITMADGSPLGGGRTVNVPTFYLLGMMHGHWDWDKNRPQIDRKRKEDLLNMGIAMVIPVEKILEVLNQPKLLEREKKQSKFFSKTIFQLKTLRNRIESPRRRKNRIRKIQKLDASRACRSSQRDQSQAGCLQQGEGTKEAEES